MIRRRESNALPFCLRDWLDLLRCPADRALLDIAPGAPAAGNSGSVPKEALRCTSCGRSFPVADEVVQFLGRPEAAGVDSELKRQEMLARDRDAEHYEQGIAPLRNQVEIPPCLRAMQPQAGDTVVELGCGTGRFTLRYAPRVRRVVALDFSTQSLLVLRRKIPPELRARILLVQADMSAPPLARGAFTKAVSFQVLEHLPTAALRDKALAEVRALLTPDGTFTATVYNWSKRKQRDAAAGLGDNALKEGFHETGIYYYNFKAEELRGLLMRAGLRPDQLQGLLIHVRGARYLGRLVVPLNRILSRTPWGLRHGYLLLAHARPDVPGERSA